jgi:hypothetical protein
MIPSTKSVQFLHRDISIDETIVGFKGRHVLVNYIKIKKHHQWGPKGYNLADSKTGYVHQTMYHTTGVKKSKFGQPYDVCDKLLANHGGKNHHLVVDNYYTNRFTVVLWAVALALLWQTSVWRKLRN